MKPFAYFILIFAAFVASIAAADRAEGYVHLGGDVFVVAEFIARGEEPNSKEVVRIPVRIIKGRIISHAWEIAPPVEYESKRKELGERKLYLPNPRLAGATIVNRGQPPKSVAWSGRRFGWPADFQLQDGDVIRIFEVIG